MYKKIRDEENEMRECTFTPRLSKNTREMTERQSIGVRGRETSEDFYAKQKALEQRR